jgi:hypothetical protein
VSVDLDLTAQAVPDAVPGLRDNGATVTGIRERDAGQVAQGVRDRDGHLAHHDTRAGPSAGGAELGRYRRQIPVNGLSAALPGLNISSFFQPDAGTGIAPGIPAEPAQDPLAGRLAPIGWQQLEQSPLVLVKLASGLSRDLQTSRGRPGVWLLLDGVPHRRGPSSGTLMPDSASAAGICTYLEGDLRSRRRSWLRPRTPWTSASGRGHADRGHQDRGVEITVFRPDRKRRSPLRIVVESNMSAIAKRACARLGTEPRQGMPWLRGEASGLPGL